MRHTNHNQLWCLWLRFWSRQSRIGCIYWQSSRSGSNSGFDSTPSRTPMGSVSRRSSTCTSPPDRTNSFRDNCTLRYGRCLRRRTWLAWNQEWAVFGYFLLQSLAWANPLSHSKSAISKGVLFADKTHSLTVLISSLILAARLVRSTTLTLTQCLVQKMTMTFLAIWLATLISRTRPKYSALGKFKFWCCDDCCVIVQLLSLPQRSLYPIARYLTGQEKESLRYPRLTPPSLSTASPYAKEKPNRYRNNKSCFAAYIGF